MNISAMSEVKVRDIQLENIAFFHRVWDQAIARRLSFAQRETNNDPLLEYELPNLWETVQKSYQRRDWESVMAFQDALRLFLERRGHASRSLILNTWACEAAEALGDKTTATRFAHDRASLLQQQRRYDEAEKLYEQCEEDYRALGENEMAIKSRHMRSLTVRAQKRFAEARTLCKSTIDEACSLGLDQWLAHPFYVLALLARDQRKFREAEQWIEESLSRLTGTTEPAMVAQCYYFLGSVALLRRDLVKARTELERSLYLSRQASGLHSIVATERLLGNLERTEGHYGTAKRTYDEALEIASQLGDLHEIARLLTEQARLMMHLGQLQDAIMLLRGAISTFNEIGATKEVIGISLLLVWLYLRQRQWNQALRALKAFQTLMSK